ncbi:ABC-type transport system involved in multi-copper enzyme maturation permease subunit [Agromyces hippuratus]|uniref:ABC-type transport system involved in multi-copper enzyme maturation permease subunit n=1 Tax=Agromyces hippuratus TaxID=286438 RepID=A0A852WV33_9MICO|nr:ABC transporter permease [Agromyces hippuratus]NYG21896.1 ABC-type transport system involved in multi-copper enzyme maturation permease subunit [Agromyces hippuratus]
MNLVRAIGSEFQKVFTTRMWWLLAILLAAYVAFMAGGLGTFLGWATENPEAAASAGGNTTVPPGTELAPLIYSFASSVGYVFPVLLGALAVTGEFRHKTLTPTFLAEPHRTVVLSAKFISQLVVGAGLGVIAFAVSVGAGAAALAGFGLDTGLDSSDTWALIGRGVLAMALWGAIGVGLGVLVVNQVAAIVIVIAFTQFVEPILRVVASLSDVTASIGRFLPGAASDALVGASFYNIASLGSTDTLEWWQGGLVLLGIAVVATVIGGATTWRRDVS